MITRSALTLILAIPCFLIAEEPAKKTTYPLKPGAQLPFHVADFVAGPHKGHCGCPSVMINNHDARGIVVWARSADEPVVKLANTIRAAVGMDDNKKQGYLIAFDTSEEKLAADFKKADWKDITIGKSRHESAQEFKKWDIDAKVAYVIFLVDHKEIKSMWSLGVSELTKEKSEAIAKGTVAFLKSAKEK